MSFRGATRQFASAFGYKSFNDGATVNIYRTNYSGGVVITFSDGGPAYAGFVDDSPCTGPMKPSSRREWSRFLAFMSKHGFHGEPRSF